jgi:hypothetical protein
MGLGLIAPSACSLPVTPDDDLECSMMSILNDDQLRELRERLQAREDALRGAGRIPAAACQQDLDELSEIAAARGRIAHGIYGQCVHCGVDLPLPALELQPTREHCAACERRA